MRKLNRMAPQNIPQNDYKVSPDSYRYRTPLTLYIEGIIAGCLPVILVIATLGAIFLSLR